LTLLGLPHPGTEEAATICLPDADILTLYYIYAMCTVLFIFHSHAEAQLRFVDNTYTSSSQ